jgi:hypothetical protein
VFLALNLLQNYDTPSAIHLLEKDQEEVLQVFRKDPADLLKAVSAKYQNPKSGFHIIALLRGLLEFCDGRKDFQQHEFDQECTTNDNVNLYGSLVGVTGSNCFGNFDSQAMRSALSKSKVYADEDVYTLDISELSSQMIRFLPIGFQSDLVGYPRL